MKSQTEIQAIIDGLKELYPDAECSLDYQKDYELLFSVRLAAQCTEARVNLVTPALYARYPTLEAFAEADVDEVGQYVHSTGFWCAKARDMVASARMLLERFGGKVPSDRADLKTLAGVGDKTANVVYAVGFGGQAIPVDTHVGRLARRIGLSQAQNPSIVMRELEAMTPHEQKTRLHHLLITHGRQVCSSQRPKCEKCPLQELCSFVTGNK